MSRPNIGREWWAFVTFGLRENHSLLEDHFAKIYVDERPVSLVPQVRERSVHTHDKVGDSFAALITAVGYVAELDVVRETRSPDPPVPLLGGLRKGQSGPTGAYLSEHLVSAALKTGLVCARGFFG